MSEELVEKLYEYQPTDEENRPIGGKQVIKYKTNEELAEKLREQNVLLIRKLRQETKKNRLGILEDEQLPEGIQRYDGGIQFAPRDLTDEERFEIARQLIDPTTAVDAMERLVEARLGAPLGKVGTKVNELEQENVALKAQVAAEAFVRSNPDYYVCDENFQTIVAWMLRYELAPSKANFQLAYETLKTQGALILGPAPIVPVVEPEPVVVPVEPTPVIPVASALNSDNSSNVGPITQGGSEIIYEFVSNGQVKQLTGLDAVRAMPGEEYKRRLLTDKNFAKMVDKLESEALAARKRG